jgi:hypothetical protein
LVWNGGIDEALADGRYVLLGGSGLGVLVDDLTGEQTVLGFGLGPEGPCSVESIGFPWVAASCAGTNGGGGFGGAGFGGAQLYSIPDHTYHVVQAPNREPCGGVPSFCHLQVGRYWIEWDNVGPGPNVVAYHYQNIATGQVVADPTTTSTVPDLNLPRLVRRVCAPLTVPQSSEDHANGLGSLQFDGKFAIAYSQRVYPLNPTIPSTFAFNLERCGSKLRLKIGSPTVVSPHLIVWSNVGIMLPSLRRVRIELPAHFGPALSITMASRHMYLVSGNSGKVWIANIPRAVAGI